MAGQFTKKGKVNPYYSFPIVLGGIILFFGTAFLFRKNFIHNCDDMRESMNRLDDKSKEAGAILDEFKKEFFHK